MIRLMLVDDQELVRNGLRMTFERYDDITIVAEAVDGRDAINRIDAARPDVVLMDLRMPGFDGISATRSITSKPRAPAVLILTMFDLDHEVDEALGAGASGYLLKNATGEQLIDAVRQAARGRGTLAPEVTSRLIEQARRSTPAAPDPRESSLTGREMAVVAALCEGLSNAAIARSLSIAEATVKSHLSSALRKLDLGDRTQLVVWAFRTGFATRNPLDNEV